MGAFQPHLQTTVYCSSVIRSPSKLWTAKVIIAENEWAGRELNPRCYPMGRVLQTRATQPTVASYPNKETKCESLHC